MARAVPDQLLSGGQHVEIFNSGLEVWLYDRSFREELRASGAFEEGADEATFQTAMARFVRNGQIMAYQLVEDDSVDLVVATRVPFTQRELAIGRWFAPQKAFLRLPTGRLVIESNDSLTIRQSAPTDPGAELEVPPGDYRATLYRVDWDALEADGIAWEGPSEIITLSAGAKAKPVRGQPSLLRWEPPGPGPVTWRIESGVYHGAVVFLDAEMVLRIALDRAGISQLGLSDGSIARLRVPELDFECVLVCITGDKRKAAYYDRMEKLLPPAAEGGKQWAHCQLDVDPGEQAVLCLRRRAKTKVLKQQQNRWLPATLQVLETRALEKK